MKVQHKTLAVAVIGILAVGIYLGAVIRWSWIKKMGGIGIQQMTHTSFPEGCRFLVDLHRGSGNGGLIPDLQFQPRTHVLDIGVLQYLPECVGHSILAPAGLGSEADYTLRFVDKHGNPVIEVRALYKAR